MSSFLLALLYKYEEIEMFSRLPDKPKLSLKERRGMGGIGGGFPSAMPEGNYKNFAAQHHLTGSVTVLQMSRAQNHLSWKQVYRELGQMRLSFLFNLLPEWTLHFVTCKLILTQVECMGHHTVNTLHCFATLKKYVTVPSNTNSSQYLFLLTP